MAEVQTTGLTLSWGNPKMFIKNLTQKGKWTKLPDAAEGTVQLTPTKGDKVEANIEDGTAEATRYKKSKYAMAYGIREAAEREMPIDHVDGVVADEYAFILIPENAKAKGLYIERTAVSVEDPLNAADGAIYTYTHDALTPSTGKQVKRGVIQVEEGADSTFTFKAKGKDFGSANDFVAIGE